MSSETHLVDHALKLPAAERASLARKLILSLEEDRFDADAEQLWEAEIEARLQQVDRGKVELREWRDSIERIRRNLRRKDDA